MLAPVVFPLCHVIKSSDKVFASKPLNVSFASVTGNFNYSDFKVCRGLTNIRIVPLTQASRTGTGRERFWLLTNRRKGRRLQITLLVPARVRETESNEQAKRLPLLVVPKASGNREI